MKISNRKWAEMILESVKSRPDAKSEIFAKYLKLIRARKQNKYLPHILRSLESLERSTQIRVESASELDEETKTTIKAKSEHFFPGTNYDFDFSINPEIIGGVRLKHQDKQIDLSIKGQLQDFKEQLWQQL